MIKQATPSENFQKAKKNKHNYSVSTQAFSSCNREFVIHNISLKKDYCDVYDIINFRRGLSYIEEIVDFKHSEISIARKGLRKFKDLLPEYLDIKESHVNTSKFHSGEKYRLFQGLQDNKYTSYVIYNTEKLNGENAQISYIYDQFWVVGSKNKALIVSNQAQLEKLKNKHQHKLTLLIARAWFNLLKTKNQNEVQAIKLELTKKTLIGQYCNSQNMQHLIDYGKQPQIFFYALVEKDNLIDDCQATSTTFKFLDLFGLPKAKCQTVVTQSYQHTIQKLRQIVVAMNELTMKEGGEGGVIYVSGVDNNGEHNQLICKVKTIQYRIYRKLREKLKVYIQKFNKNYQNLLKKFTKEIAQIARQFQLNRPLQTYIQIARRSFILCEDQSRPISRFVSNRFINFLRLVQKNISKQKFLQIVNSSKIEYQEQQEVEKPQKMEQQEAVQSSQNKIEQRKIKQVLVLIPVTIPSTGKTSLLEIVSKKQTNFRIWSVSSDEIKRKIMDELKKKKKTMSQQQAFQKSRQPTNKQYYKQMGQIFKNISLSKQENHVFYLDKNHPENALKKTIQQLNERSTPFTNLQLLKLGLFPQCLKRFEQKGSYRYPFSPEYVLTCLKRVSQRQEHLTLQGNEEKRLSVVLGFANLFRNFSLSPFHIQKYFDGKIEFGFNNEQCLDFEKDAELLGLFKDILLSIKPGSFDVGHPKLKIFIQVLKQWNIQQKPLQILAADALTKLQGVFLNFEKFTKNEQKQVQKQ